MATKEVTDQTSKTSKKAELHFRKKEPIYRENRKLIKKLWKLYLLISNYCM